MTIGLRDLLEHGFGQVRSENQKKIRVSELKPGDRFETIKDQARPAGERRLHMVLDGVYRKEKSQDSGNAVITSGPQADLGKVVNVPADVEVVKI